MEREEEHQVSFESAALDRVILHAIETMEKSKEQIFEIAENARLEGGNLKKELDQVQAEVERIIHHYDQLEAKYKKMRLRLMEVSHNFKRYNEQDIREAYEQANQCQIDLKLASEREKYLRKRRDELERRLKTVERTIEKADNLLSQVSVVLGYLQGDIARMTEALEHAKNGHIFGLKIIEAQEEERKRVAREMHDGPAQSIANLVLRTEIVEKVLNQNEAETARKELQVLKKMARDSLSDVRKIIYDLRPMALDDLGLIPTLRKFVDAYIDRYHLYIDFKVVGMEERLPSTTEVAIFRLVQESLNNIIKHAEATMVQVLLEFKPLKLTIRIKDNGKGMPAEALKKENSFGLIGMKERVKLLQGEMEIRSKPGRGTEILIQVPILSSPPPS
ncbi:sensor histidine kinase [Thermicanus aegyptius]|uniref:sensor histidine kinase n=1 Tax=Thermicanus aegyptius TaxID=94009 RepID=UPI000420D233|nr:sensor histidine kinase [Thermicanus aegyptius]